MFFLSLRNKCEKPRKVFNEWYVCEEDMAMPQTQT